jgi:signal-transduction protein with cAMP-binding, CBS, and nucleotidyltransferase domain
MNENSHVRVGDVMTTSLRMIKRSATVAQAIESMRDAGVSSLVVERRDDTDEFGLVAITDIAREVTSKDRPAERVNVYEVMTKPVLSLPLDMRTEYAVRLLVRFKLSRALVVNHARTPVGIVTLRDMVLRHHSDTKRTSTK